ncbi:hypothetical protein TC41_1014 [Alicyclobacillus acidocaldarius subsp. acidocaldarius Tc-4-1]|uniref:Uncharacterized protein n=1 Tax=Alicyclobacillus acidocaldarius (strain Tc-4-1) TaxID=1048834 RepID=F8IFZ6_ALIAT|nr:hypothetical protein TC41_1014 [Alicyclobacillus acidocaldarius subsp. acidocaldarius Tc-4-1]
MKENFTYLKWEVNWGDCTTACERFVAQGAKAWLKVFEMGFLHRIFTFDQQNAPCVGQERRMS